MLIPKFFHFENSLMVKAVSLNLDFISFSLFFTLGKKITIPSLMVTASHDFILKHEYSLHMEDFIPDLKRLYIKDCSHWTLCEKPHEFNTGFIKWLDGLHKVTSKMWTMSMTWLYRLFLNVPRLCVLNDVKLHQQPFYLRHEFFP